MAGVMKNLVGKIGRGMVKGLRIGLAVGVAAGLLIGLTTPPVTLLSLAAVTASTTFSLGGFGLAVGAAVGAIKGIFSSPSPDGEALVTQAEAACPAQGAGGPSPAMTPDMSVPSQGQPGPGGPENGAVAREVQDVADVLRSQGGGIGAAPAAGGSASWQDRVAAQAQAESSRAR